MKKINLGDKVRDKVTGFEGIAISRIEYLNGCIQFGVKARVKNATLKEAEYIDETQLKRVSAGINKPVEEVPPGGIMPDRPK